MRSVLDSVCEGLRFLRFLESTITPGKNRKQDVDFVYISTQTVTCVRLSNKKKQKYNVLQHILAYSQRMNNREVCDAGRNLCRWIVQAGQSEATRHHQLNKPRAQEQSTHTHKGQLTRRLEKLDKADTHEK